MKKQVKPVKKARKTGHKFVDQANDPVATLKSLLSETRPKK